MTHAFGISPDGETWVMELDNSLFFDGGSVDIAVPREAGEFHVHYQPQFVEENQPAREIVAGLSNMHIALTGVVYLLGLSVEDVARIVRERVGGSE